MDGVIADGVINSNTACYYYIGLILLHKFEGGGGGGGGESSVSSDFVPKVYKPPQLAAKKEGTRKFLGSAGGAQKVDDSFAKTTRLHQSFGKTAIFCDKP